MQRVEIINKIMESYKDYDEKIRNPPPRISDIKEILKDLDKFTNVKVYAGPNIIKIDDLNKNEPADDKVVDEKLHPEIFANPLKFIYAGTETFKISIGSNTKHEFFSLFACHPWTSNVFYVLKENNIDPPKSFSKKYNHEDRNYNDDNNHNHNNDNDDDVDGEEDEGGVTYM
jgi:hypothetical protein